MLLSGHTAWVAGDVLMIVEAQVWHLDVWPAWSDILFLSGYGFLVVGALNLVRSRRQQRDVTALLDAAIITLGVAVPTVAFVVGHAALEMTSNVYAHVAVGEQRSARDERHGLCV